MFKIMLFCATLLIFISGCGSSNGGGTTMFNTVNMTASVDSTKNPLLSDLATWTDQTNRCNGIQIPTITNDLVNFTIVSVSSITNSTPSSVVLQKATVIFTPGDSLTPALPALYATTYLNLVGQTVTAGGTLSVPVEVVSHNLKAYFDPCTIPRVYTYNVQVLFDAVESGTGKSGTIPAGMTVRIADFTN